MSIKHIETKIKIGETSKNNTERLNFLDLDNSLFVILTIILVAFASFGLGRLSVNIQEKTPIIFPQKFPVFEQKAQAYIPQDSEQIEPNLIINNNLLPQVQSGSVVASKNGAKYHFPWCSGAVRIKDENKIWFDNVEEAKKAGYEPASNCKGLE